MRIRFNSINFLKIYNKKVRLTPDFLVAYAWILPVVIEALSGFAYILTGNTKIVTLALYMVLILGIAANFNKINTCFSYVDLGVFFFFAVSILGTLLFFPQNAAFVQERIAVWPYLIIYYITGKLSRYGRDTIRCLCKASAVGIFLGTFVYYVVFKASGKNMSFAYAFLPCVLGVITGALEERKISYLIFSIIGLWIQFLLGTRGPVLFIAIYLAYQFFFYCDNWKKKSLLFSLVALVLVLMQESIYLPILERVNKILLSKGINSEILFLLTTHNTASIDIRTDFYEQLLKIALSNPFAIHGLCGEYLVGGVYAHNLVVEIVFDYGLIMGMVICAVFFIWLFKGYLKVYKYKHCRDLYALIICGLFLKFLLSSSFLGDVQFCFGLALISALIDQVKHKSMT